MMPAAKESFISLACPRGGGGGGGGVTSPTKQGKPSLGYTCLTMRGGKRTGKIHTYLFGKMLWVEGGGISKVVS